MIIGDTAMIDDTVAAKSKEVEQKLLSRIKDKKERAIVEGHFRKLEEIRAKYIKKDEFIKIYNSEGVLTLDEYKDMS